VLNELVNKKPINDKDFDIFLNKIDDMKKIKFNFCSKLKIIFCSCFESKKLHYMNYIKGREVIEHELDIVKILKDNII